MKTKQPHRALEDTRSGNVAGGLRMAGRCLQALLFWPTERSDATDFNIKQRTEGGVLNGNNQKT